MLHSHSKYTSIVEIIAIIEIKLFVRQCFATVKCGAVEWMLVFKSGCRYACH